MDDDTNEKTFRVLNADFNGSGTVDFNDFSTLMTQFGQANAIFAQGDADYSGTVDYDDYTLLQANYGLSLPALPTVPGEVAVGNATPGTISVSWAASATETRDGFKIYRSADGQTFDLVAAHVDKNAEAWQDPDTGLTLGKRYWYRVRSYTTANGASAAATKASAIVTQPINAPTNPLAAGIGPDRVSLMWTAPADSSVVAYRVYRSQTPNVAPSAATLVTTVSNKLRIIDSGLSRGHTYYYKVVAVGPGGIASLPSAEVAVVAQNEGAGFSNQANGYEPFGPTHDSDGDGTADPFDTDNDNDGTPDEQDDDDDDNGVNDNEEPDDRDSDEDGTPDNGDPDTASDDVYNDKRGFPVANIVYQRDLADWADFSYSNSESEVVLDDDYETVRPKLSFSGDEVNDSQAFTYSNLPKHSIVASTARFSEAGSPPHTRGDPVMAKCRLRSTVKKRSIRIETLFRTSVLKNQSSRPTARLRSNFLDHRSATTVTGRSI